MGTPQPQPGAGSLTGAAKLDAVTKLLEKLTRDLDKIDLSPHERDAALEELKIYGRDPKDAGPIFTKQGIETLTRHAFDSPSTTTSHNALRCLANTLLINVSTRQMLVDLGYESKACAQLKRDTLDDEFLISRVILLTTYDTNIDLVKLIDQYRLADTIVDNLAKHANKALSVKSGKAKVNPMEDMALSETLKLMFNLTHHCPDRLSLFTPAIPHVRTLLIQHDVPTPKPLDPPMNFLVHPLVVLDLQSKDGQSSLFPKGEENAVAEKLVHLLDLSMQAYEDTDLEEVVMPLVSTTRRVHEIAPQGVREFMRSKLLPTAEDREDILGRGDTVSARLLRNSINPLTPQFRNNIYLLLFDMSDNDSSKFVDNLGYGYASGFLFQNGIPVPKNASEARAMASYGDGEKPFNPITGQFLDKEKFPEIPEMTEEEKEREAERLFVLFERLKATGIVDIQNPVEKAFREGRFEELDDDEDMVEKLD